MLRWCVQEGGPTGLGDLYLKGIRGWTRGGGGLTVARHLGDVYIEDYQYRGELHVPPLAARYPGFQANSKVRYRNRNLSDAQVNAMSVAP